MNVCAGCRKEREGGRGRKRENGELKKKKEFFLGSGSVASWKASQARNALSSHGQLKLNAYTPL